MYLKCRISLNIHSRKDIYCVCARKASQHKNRGKNIKWKNDAEFENSKFITNKKKIKFLMKNQKIKEVFWQSKDLKREGKERN